jgi:hypothetical protein
MKLFYKLGSALTIILLSSAMAIGQTTVNSIISSNQTWTAAGSPYIVSANVLVETGVTVTVEPGVHIRSTATRLKIIIDGEFIAIGKKDSAIVADSVTFDFTAKSVEYDPATGNGSQFKYVLFRNPASGGTMTISLKGQSMLVRNCKFLNGYYNIYSYASPYDTSEVIVDKTIFKGGVYPQGYMVYCSGTIRLTITDCYAENVGGISLGQWTTIKKSTFKNFGYSGGLRQTRGNELILECNLFQNFRYTILDLTYPSANSIIEVNENTFDSCDVLVKLRGGASYRPAKFVVKNNNFLHFNDNSVQVSVGSNPGQADTFDMTKNYWGTTTKADIEAGINDFNDDITKEGLIDFSGYLTSQVKNCTAGGTIGGADTSSSTAGITKLISADISMFPNPATTTVEVSAYGKQINEILVYNLQGQTELNKTFKTTSAQLDVSSMLNGIYIIQVKGNGFVTRNKLIIKR